MIRPHWRTRLPRPRKPADRTEWIAAAFIALAALSAAFHMFRAALRVIFGHWYIGVPTAIFVVAAIAAWWWWKASAATRRAARLRHLRLTLAELDALGYTDFELAVRDLMVRDGIDARHVGQRGDKAADVIGHAPGGYLIVAQCKHTTTQAKVGAPVIYTVNGTAHPAHNADVAVVITNGAFTSDAREAAAAFRIHRFGREELHRWATEGVSLPELLKLTTPLRRMRRLRHTSNRLIRHDGVPRSTPSRREPKR
ncbi:restriction endonuclease [Streptosporangium sp. NBC_01495]|uniref:restriction endonuclease n=1 Tax=Streptosporangium sp. NBC_01495 TaxID=2903899 RepID=UPI002E33AEE4|nr:restriction endonuclease [Streptosporangium sp. NBC_01495]